MPLQPAPAVVLADPREAASDLQEVAVTDPQAVVVAGVTKNIFLKGPLRRAFYIADRLYW